MDFPPDDTLIARGKYATLGSEKRAELKRLHDHMTAITDQARVIVRWEDQAETMTGFYEAMLARVMKAGECLAELAALQAELEGLKPAAWPEKEKRA